MAPERAPAIPAERVGRHESTPPLALLAPLLLSIPFMYWPRVIESDTQPWVVIGAAVAALFYWPRRADFSKAFPVVATILGILAFAAYWIREPDSEMVRRYGVILGTFIMLWHVGQRGVPSAVGTFVRITIVLWFVVGFYQTIAVRLGLPVDFFGRYVAGRSGVPSLTVEASFYGSISVLHLMYLIADRRRYDWVFYGLAIGSVLLSGSLLSFLLLTVPFFRLPTRLKLAVGVAVLLVLLLGVDLQASGFFGRVVNLTPGAFWDSLLSDYSSNLRAGHVVFTYYEALPRELMFRTGPDFFYEYNQWAFLSRVFVPNDSGFILPSGGELLFRSGALGLLLILMILKAAYQSADTAGERIEKVVFVMACMINPISLINPVFILYVHKRYTQQ